MSSGYTQPYTLDGAGPVLGLLNNGESNYDASLPNDCVMGDAVNAASYTRLFASLADCLDSAARTESGMNFFNGRGQREHALSYADIRARAQLMASRLLGLGLKRNERVGIVADMHPDFVCAFFACQYAGLLAVPLPVISGLGGKQGYEEHLARVLDAAHVRVAIGPETSLPSLRIAADGLTLALIGSYDTLCALTPSDRALEPLRAGESSHIQFSSGSTRHPKGILISQDAVMANTSIIVTSGLKATAQDRLASWLPFYHDMGLIGCMLAPITAQMSVDYLYTDDFAKRPLQWLQLISKQRSTISFSPTFGYDICSERLRGNQLELDLSAWRVAGIGGEMVQAETLAKFVNSFAPHGFKASALMPCYGMAETTLAVTFSDAGKGMKVDYVEKSALLEGKAKAASPDSLTVSGNTRAITSCGVPLPGTRIEIRNGAGSVLSERRVGHIHVLSACVMDGYDGSAEATNEAIGTDGWLHTGDMGYISEGQLYITGRAKDMIIVNGRNIWPHDLEWHAEEHIDALRRRDTAALSIEGADGREMPVILVQCRSNTQEGREQLKSDVHALLLRHHGINCKVVLIPPRSLPFTTSGKLSRAKAKLAYLAGEYAYPNVTAFKPAPSYAETSIYLEASA